MLELAQRQRLRREEKLGSVRDVRSPHPSCAPQTVTCGRKHAAQTGAESGFALLEGAPQVGVHYMRHIGAKQVGVLNQLIT